MDELTIKQLVFTDKGGFMLMTKKFKLIGKAPFVCEIEESVIEMEPIIVL